MKITDLLQPQLEVVILKGAPGEAKQEPVAVILSSGPYLNVQTPGVSRVV